MSELLNLIAAKYNYWAYIVLMMIGLWAIIAKRNLVKKIIGMSIFQTAIILFYVSAGFKRGATIPILEHGHGAAHPVIDPAHYANPLPHVLMLTAIVVGVGTLGVALALCIRIYKQYKTLDEDDILAKLRHK